MMSIKKQNEYTELNNIEGTGTQYINTEVETKQSLKIECTFSGSKTGKLLFGARKDIDSDGLTWGANSSMGAYCGFGGATQPYNTTVNTVDNNKHTIIMSNDIYTIDDVNQILSDRGTFTEFYNIYLFTWNNSDIADTRRFQGKVYDFKIYDNDVLIQHLVPVLDSENTPCMYDKVTQKFYYNNGTGDFLYGEKES
jgi:hypothetical protein